LKIKIYRTIILPIVLYECETWSLKLREERRLRGFENRVLRKIIGPEWEEVTGEWRKQHNDELNDLYSLPNIVRVIKSRIMRWAGYVARMVEKRAVYRVRWVNLRERNHLGDPGVDGSIVLRLIFRKWDVGNGLDRCGSGQGQLAGTCECGNEPLGSINCGKFLV
jgi:hypothetical protein